MNKLLSISFLSLLVISCSKKKLTPVDAAVKKSFNYKEGTYWIYKDQLSSEVDSYTVTYNYNQNIDAETYLIENIEIRMDAYCTNVPGGNSIDTVHGIPFTISQNHISTFAGKVDYPFVAGQMNEDGYLLNIYDTYTAPAGIFRHTAVVAHSKFANPAYVNDTFFINDQAGVVKFITVQKSDTGFIQRSMELQRYKIIR